MKHIYLDNAATTMHKPACVAQAIVGAMTSMGNAGRGGSEAALSAARVIYDTRERLAKLFGAADARNIAFTCNSTESLNIAIKGSFQPGDHIITTAIEHNSVLRPVYEMEAAGVEVTIVPADVTGKLDMEVLKNSFKANTKGVICIHGSNLIGDVQDVKTIGALAHEHGAIMIVDASQTAGVIDIDVEDMNIDILCFTGHKGLLGPQGTGGIYVKEGVEVKALKSGGSGVDSFSKTHPTKMPTRLEAGTLNGHGIAGLHAALGYIEEHGVQKIHEEEMRLAKMFYDGIKDIEELKFYGDYSTDHRCAIVSLNIGDYDSAEVSDELLTRFGISTRPGAHCAPLLHKAMGTAEQGLVRFSFSHMNTEDEVKDAIEAVRTLALED